MSVEQGRWEANYSRSERRIALLWVDEADPTNVEYIWDTQAPTSHPRGFDTHPEPENASTQTASSGGGESDGTGTQVRSKVTADEDGALAPVQISEGESKAPAADDGEPEYYWPNIQRYIDSHEGPRPSVKCAICWEGLFHPSVCSSRSRHHLEPLEVLSCNHVVGRLCWDNVVIDAMIEMKPPTCPFCRASQHSWGWRSGISEAEPWQQPSG